MSSLDEAFLRIVKCAGCDTAPFADVTPVGGKWETTCQCGARWLSEHRSLLVTPSKMEVARLLHPLIAYAADLLEEADTWQVSNADCEWRDVKDAYFEDEDVTAEDWKNATIRERLWDYGAGDQRLDAIVTVTRGALRDHNLTLLHEACTTLRDYLIDDYGANDYEAQIGPVPPLEENS